MDCEKYSLLNQLEMRATELLVLVQRDQRGRRPGDGYTVEGDSISQSGGR